MLEINKNILQKKNITILQQINVKICPSGIRCNDSNPQPSEHESPTVTTRPGLLHPITRIAYSITKYKFNCSDCKIKQVRMF